MDKAREAFVRVASGKDPESAMVWAATISDDAVRMKSTTAAYEAWKKRDAAAADSALEKSALSDEQKNAIRSSGSAPPH